ncbi:tropomyosin-1, isoforms 9A/A/B-like [Panicum virgatum]|uniref:tropomyosin-1, isoforms 9A/A/B-like n=1 Tax=Panicum virgatum TaxID=38727 RepID=UPI0019D54F4D|nr:tropomyosin-1, isoforms 9A/A/B-like [Panicum virgatum]
MEAELQRMETELQRERATVAMITGTLEEKDKALEEKYMALWNMEVALKEKEDSLFAHQEATRDQQEEAQEYITELKKAVANETAAKEAANTAFTAVQDEYAELERTTVAMSQELEGANAQPSSSMASRLRALGDRVTEHAKSTFRLGVQRALAVAWYVVLSDASTDAASAIMNDADAAIEEFAAALTEKLEADIPPIAEFDAVEDPPRGEDNL